MQFKVEYRTQTSEVKSIACGSQQEALDQYAKLTQNTSVRSVRLSYRIPHSKHTVIAAELGTKYFPIPVPEGDEVEYKKIYG